MRFYRQQSQPDGPYEDLSSGGRMLVTPAYWEFEIPLDGGGFGVSYLVPRDPNSVWVCTCLLDTFTDMITTYISTNKATQAALLVEYRNTWPTVCELLDAGIAERFSPGALVVLEDPDDATGKWFGATVIGNLSAFSREALFTQRTEEATERVFTLTDAAVKEFATWNPDRFRFNKNILVNTVGNDVRAYAGFVRDNFGSILGALGS
jgi:hypothetical protein